MPRRNILLTLALTALSLMPSVGGLGAVPPKNAPRGVPSRTAASPKKDRSWMLQPDVFRRLSAGGRRKALFLNGLGPRPAAPPQRPSNLTAHSAGSPRPLAAAPRQNIRVDDPTQDQVGHTHSESSIAVRGTQVVVGFNDASQNTAGYGFSTDGGATFTHRRLPEISGGGNFGDPVMALGPNGEVYYANLILNGFQQSSVGVAKSTDGGATFGTPVDAASFIANSFDVQDKDWLAVDAGPASPRKGNVYVSWTDFLSTGQEFILFSRSTDGGQSFDDPVGLSPIDGAGVQNSVIAVAPNGDVYVAYEDGHITPDGITIVKSTDGGASWKGPTAVASLNPLSLLTGGGGVRATSYPTMTVDGKGVVHIAWGAVSSGSLLDRSDIFYTRSSDGGATFSSPRKLNDDGTTTTQAFPFLAAAADGSVAVKWMDRRNDSTNDSLTDAYMTISRDGGTTFGKSFRITDHNWVYGPVESALAAGYHGDYDGLAADGGNFYATWSDERGSNADVYFTFVPTGFDPTTPDFNISARQVYGVVAAGQSITFDITTSVTNGFAGSLALSVSPVAGLTYSLASSAVAAGQPGQFTVSTSSLTRAGDYLVGVAAAGGGLARTTNVRLTVYDANRAAGPPANLTATPGFTAGAGVKADPSGNLHLLYEDDTAAVMGNDIFYRRSADGGRTFTSSLKLNASGSFGTDAALAVDGSGRVVAVWTGLGANDSTSRLFTARSTDGGATFASPVALSPTSQFAQFPTVAIDSSGKVIVAYYDASRSPPPIQTVRSTDGGATFGPAVAVPENSAAAITRPGLAFDSKGNAYLVYTQEISTTTTFTAIARVAVAGPSGSFSQLFNVSDLAVANGFGPDVAVAPDDSLYVSFYYRFGATVATWNRDVAVVRSTDGGKTFSSYVNVSNDPGQSYFPSITVEPGGAADVVWEDSSASGETDVFFSRSTDGGRTFSAPLNVSENLGLSGSTANPFAGVGGAGRAAVSVGQGGNLLVSWTDDSPANTDVFLAAVNPNAVVNNPPTATITAPVPGFTVAAGIPVTFTGTGSDPNGDPITFTWTFGDGTTAFGASPPPHPFAVPGVYTATLTVSDPRGATGTATVAVNVSTPAFQGFSLLVPVVVETPGLGGSQYSTELTLVSRETSPTDVQLLYTAAAGGGSGYARLTLSPGELRVLPGIVQYLRDRNVPIPSDGQSHVGTLLVSFGNVGSSALVFAGARTYTANPSGGTGTFGVFYPAAFTTATPATIFGLQQNDSQRSNVAVVNAGADPVTLRVSLEGPNGEDLGSLPDQRLDAYGWWQFGQPLLGKATSGRAIVTRVAGSSPFSAYGVLNDAVTSDGSFIPPLLGGDTSGADRLLPIVLDVQGIGARFRTEVTLTNFTNNPLPLTLVYRPAAGLGSGSGNVGLTLAAKEQRIIPDVIAFLRGSLPIDAAPANVGGSLLVQAPSGTATDGLAVGARTFVPLSPSGTYGLFYTGLTLGESASSPVHVYGLQENAAQRSNLAIVNRGDAGDTITLRVTWYSSSGAVLGPPVDTTLAAGQWFQLNRPLEALGISAGYAQVERTAGLSRFVAYGVLNDNVTQDGSYIAMSP